MRLLLLLLTLHCCVWAQGEYSAVGSPKNPQVDIRWNTYHSHGEISKYLQQMAAKFPKYCKLINLGSSYGKRQMWVLQISSPVGDAVKKPGFWIDGGIHANEIQSVEVALYSAWYLLEMKEKSPFIQKLLKERTFYIMPMMSPDSRDAHMTQPNLTHTPRTGMRPVDDDLDGQVDEDGFDDLDGDGSITQMRRRDDNGMWIEDPEYPGLMKRVKEGEKGQYTLLGQEGIDNDGDGRFDEDGDGSYDPNRNWAWNWQPPYVQRGAHHYPFSIPEVRLVSDFILSRENIAGAQTYHNVGGMLLIGPGDPEDVYQAQDMNVYKKLAAVGEKIIPGYKLTQVGKDLYRVWGGELDWLYKMRGVYSFNNELFTAKNFFQKDQGKRFIAGSQEMHDFDRLLLFKQGVTAWSKVKHPQYGDIEVGGFKKNWRRQAPSFLLEEECHRNMAFTLFHADQLALVKIEDVTVKKVSSELYEVTALLKNNKLCPSHSAQDVQKKIAAPNILKLDGNKLKVHAALTSSHVSFRHAAEQKKNPTKVKINSIASYGSYYVRWLVSGNGQVKLSFKSQRAGYDEVSVELK